MRSHPTWVRGLKHFNQHFSSDLQRVAPYVGAWIETKENCSSLERKRVAPYVGAWIETYLTRLIGLSKMSRTLRGCVD